ncbi:MAG: DUF2332 domain-containing protein [Acidimicrobiales bacterium]
MTEELDLDQARKHYHFALAPEDYERLPFYTALLHEFENDQITLELLASVRAQQRNPMLVLAALHLAALNGHDVLGPMYDDARHGTLEDPKGAALRVMDVVRFDPGIVRSQLWRSTQTNEPGRSAVIQAVIGDIARDVKEINLIEVGASAGINLCFDQFPLRASDDHRALTLVCEDLTPIDRSRPMPTVRSRIGIDPEPLDLDNEEDRLWLKACLWPEQRRRHERFDAIVDAHRSWPHVTMLKGSAIERLDDAFALCNSDVMTVVMNTWSAFYFSPDERTAYFAELARRCAQSNVAWISMESTMVKWPGIDVDEAAHHRAASQVVLMRPSSAPVVWGWCHAHGRWLEQTTVS